MNKYKNYFAVIIVVFFMNITSAFSQNLPIYVDDVELNSIENLEYLSIVVVNKGLGTKSKVIVDYGQKINWASLGSPKIRTSKGGNVKAFNGSLDALNFFYANGWVFINHSTIESGISGIGNVFLLKRK